MSGGPLCRVAHTGVGRKEAVSLGVPADEPGDCPPAGVPVSKSPFSSPCSPFLLPHGLEQLGSSLKLCAPLVAMPEAGQGGRRVPSPDPTKDTSSSGRLLLHAGSWPSPSLAVTEGGGQVSP